ncbi:hypothetical protein ABE504_08635 [Paenibacillus oryzisoli]|uniref:hypothetical protein n=1 Tax=Paenibacillus oryzisoli TaxID=1850517 RepID=UPI003D29E01D
MYLIIFLSIKISNGFYQRRIAFTGSSDVHDNDKIVTEAFGIFTNWPNSFYDFLYDFKKIPKNSQLLTGLKRDFGRFQFEIIKLSKIDVIIVLLQMSTRIICEIFGTEEVVKKI